MTTCRASSDLSEWRVSDRRGQYIRALAAALLAGTIVPDARQYAPPLSLGTPRPPGDPVTPTGPLTAPTIDRQIGNLDDRTPIFEDAFGNRYIFERGTGQQRYLSELVGNRLVDRYFADLRLINAINVQSRIVGGIELNWRLPDPEAGLGYLPGLLTGGTAANQNSQRIGYLTELRFANTIAADPRQTVVRWGSNVNSPGADIVSVRDDGTVSLWDTKFRSNPMNIPGSSTFSPGSTALANALEQATRAIERNITLPPNVRTQALANLAVGNFNAHTPGAGAARNSAIRRFCRFAVCGNWSKCQTLWRYEQ
jgi:hypothetical protein